MRLEAALSVVAAASAIILVALAAATATLPPCEHEDSPGRPVCYWDASERGNQLGNSFIRIGDSIWYL